MSGEKGLHPGRDHTGRVFNGPQAGGAVPATTRRVSIPAEYADFERTVLVKDSEIKWEHIVCENKVTADTANKIKVALNAAGILQARWMASWPKRTGRL